MKCICISQEQFANCDRACGHGQENETPAPVKSENDLWEEALSFLVNNPALNYPSQIAELKSKYIITKR